MNPTQDTETPTKAVTSTDLLAALEAIWDAVDDIHGVVQELADASGLVHHADTLWKAKEVIEELKARAANAGAQQRAAKIP